MRGKDSIINQFAANEAPYYLIVKGGRECIGSNRKLQNMDDAIAKFTNDIGNIEANDRTKYSIYCYEELPDNKLKGEVSKVLKLGEHDYLLYYTAFTPSPEEEDARTNWRVQQELQRRELQEKLDRIETALMAKKLADNDEDDDDVAEETEPKSMVGALMENPQIQGALAGALSAWLTKVIAPTAGPMAVAGVPEETAEDTRLARLNTALDILAQYDDKLIEHLEKLATMAQKDTAKFKFLLNML